jgi:hypothetical protein
MQPDTVFGADYYFDVPGSNFSEFDKKSCLRLSSPSFVSPKM